MQSLIITCVLVIAFILPCFCYESNFITKNAAYNVIDYGAKGDGKTDDSQAFVKAFQSACRAQGTVSLVIPSNYVFFISALTLKGPCSSSLQIQVIAFNSCNKLSVSDLSIVNSPKTHLKISNCQGAHFSYISISAPGSSPNTDGIDISDSKNIIITNSKIASGDDCISVGSGSSYINISGIACGPGHGISVGSLGKNHDTVSDVYVKNCKFTGTTNGARIKTFPGGSGYAKRITFEQITLSQTRNPIIINNFYNGQTARLLNGAGVKVSEVTFRGFKGTCTHKYAINLNCGPTGCFNIVLDHNNIVSSQRRKKALCSCNNAHGKATNSISNCSCLKP
ncbi:hypothetical protein VNO78_07207 [Psophocarpus tetragonolobus]|uniref:Polygalacturonase n=1 Tax=Psophocarpus tetragonolobus TaxID=3891 RepID=A0AAN9STX0_PSOTE